VHIRQAIVASCALVAVGVACSGSNGGSAAPTTSAPPTTAARPAATTTTRPATPTTLAAGSLGALIADDLPGWTRQPDDVGDTGPVDLSKATLDDVGGNLSSDPRAELTSDGFDGGYQRQWTTTDAFGEPVQGFVFLYRFDNPDGAARYAGHWHEALLSTNQGAAVGSFTPAFMPGATGLTVSDKSGSTAIAIATKGQYALKAQVTGAPNADQSGPAGQLALAQYSRLP
jgi:hypothetical protein